jgi:photosystem II stability/assembly factor-like uncharacterized protein
MSENTQTDIVYALACTQNGEKCFAARASGLYRSVDGGQTWSFAYGSLEFEEPVPTTSVVVTPFDKDHSVFAGATGGVLRSTDGGETWLVAGLGTPPPAVSSLVISPDFIRDGILFAGTLEDGVYRCADRGTHWVAWNFGLLDLNVFSLAISPDFANDETLFVGVESGVFRSTNGGRAWREVDLPIGFEPVLCLGLSPAYARDGVLFAGTESQGVLKSADRGKTWVQLRQDVINGPVNGIVLDPDFANTPHVLLVLEDRLMISRNGGQSWDVWLADVPELSAVCAPQGLGPDAELLIGTVAGDVMKVKP